MIKKIGLILVACLGNYWIWRVFDTSFILGISLIIISILLIFKIKIFAWFIIIALSVFLLKTNFDSNLSYISSLEKDQLSNRHEYYAQSLGKVYRNRVSIYLHNKISPYIARYSKNLAYNLDPNLYFFAAHPRERVGVDEFEKFPIITLPFLLIGLGTLLSGGYIFLISTFIASLLISAFIFPGYNPGPILIFPYISVAIYLGLIRVFKLSK